LVKSASTFSKAPTLRLTIVCSDETCTLALVNVKAMMSSPTRDDIFVGRKQFPHRAVSGKDPQGASSSKPGEHELLIHDPSTENVKSIKAKGLHCITWVSA